MLATALSFPASVGKTKSTRLANDEYPTDVSATVLHEFSTFSKAPIVSAVSPLWLIKTQTQEGGKTMGLYLNSLAIKLLLFLPAFQNKFSPAKHA